MTSDERTPLLSHGLENCLNVIENCETEEDVLSKFIIKDFDRNFKRPIIIEAFDLARKENVMIKIIRKPFSYDSEIILHRWRTVFVHLLDVCNSSLDEHLNHIMRIYRILETPRCIYIVSEKMLGKELFEFLVSEKAVPEEACKYITKQILISLQYLHEVVGVIHRDVKPENIMFKNYVENDAMENWAELQKWLKIGTKPQILEAKRLWRKQLTVALVDFDMCAFIDNIDSSKIVGTYGYLAPEILLENAGYTIQTDLWSVGVILYILITGRPPVPIDRLISAEDSVKIFQQIKEVGINYSCQAFKEFSVAKDLIQNLLQFDRKKRTRTTTDALNHPWFHLSYKKQISDISTTNTTNYLHNVSSIDLIKQNQNQVKKTILKILQS